MFNSKGRCGSTFIWAVENFCSRWIRNIESPVFLSNSLDGSEWKMSLYPNISTYGKDYMSLNIKRCDSEDKGLKKIILDCELSFLDGDGSPLVSKGITTHGFSRHHKWECIHFVKHYDVFKSRKNEFLPFDILTIRCQLWRNGFEKIMTELLFSRTKIERNSFVWNIPDFGSFKRYQRNKIYLDNALSDTSFLTFEFFMEEDDVVEIEVRLAKLISLEFLCNISILDVNGKVFKSKSDSYYFGIERSWPQSKKNSDQQVWRFPSFITKSSLIQNSSLYLPMGKLTLRVECFFYTGTYSKNENSYHVPIKNFQLSESTSKLQQYNNQYITEHEVSKPKFPDNSESEDFANSQKTENGNCTSQFHCSLTYDLQCNKQYIAEPEVKKSNFADNSELEDFDKSQNTGNGNCVSQFHCSFIHDIQCMYEDGILSDFILLSDNKEFPVHKFILSARSPVFRDMFTSNMSEKEIDVFEIPDVDADTLQRMLLFLYSNRMEEDLHWVSAMNLYFAADKYAIDDLKLASCSILKSELCVSNALEILVHADLHQDQDLKSIAQDFIIDHDSEIIGSGDWKRLLTNHIHLTVEILSDLYTKKIKK